MRPGAWLAALALFACAPPGPPPGLSHVSEIPEPPAPKRHCPKLDREAGARALVRGRAFVESLKVEEHPESDVYARGMSDLRTAADNGEIEGQYRYGVLKFGFLFTDRAPEQRDEKAYVDALSFVRIAALRGYESAAGFLPGFGERSLPATLPEPLDSIPHAWLVEADQRAAAWLDCAPKDLRTLPPAPPKSTTRLDASDNGWTRRGDPEGPLLRIQRGRPSPFANQLIEQFPEIFDCYRALLAAQPQPQTLVVTVDSSHKAQASGDESLRSCVERSLPTPAGDEHVLRLEIELHPHAADASALPDAANEVEHWAEDGSCWSLEDEPPCPKNKICEAPETIRVRCP